jgi:hypothetical protein
LRRASNTNTYYDILVAALNDNSLETQQTHQIPAYGSLFLVQQHKKNQTSKQTNLVAVGNLVAEDNPLKKTTKKAKQNQQTKKITWS